MRLMKHGRELRWFKTKLEPDLNRTARAMKQRGAGKASKGSWGLIGREDRRLISRVSFVFF